MPGGNRTGPMGSGPMTGRGAGFCAGTGARKFASYGYAGGLGRGGCAGGMGKGMGRGAQSPPSQQPAGGPSNPTDADELNELHRQAAELGKHLRDIQQRIQELRRRTKSVAVVNKALCVGCGACVNVCAHDALSLSDGIAALEDC